MLLLGSNLTVAVTTFVSFIVTLKLVFLLSIVSSIAPPLFTADRYWQIAVRSSLTILMRS